MEAQTFTNGSTAASLVSRFSVGDLGRPAALDRPGIITRDRLVSALLSRADSDVIIVVAPGGYGKTTMLAQWVEAQEREVAWVTLDGRHDDPALLIASVAAALARVKPIDDAVLAPLASPAPDIARVIVPRLCESLTDGPPMVLVLDDVHTVHAREARAALSAIAKCFPSTSQVVIASREEPAIRLGRLRTERSVAELGVEEIAMTHSEASRLFRASGQELPRSVVSAVVDRTEGWPAALYLAALWLESEDDVERAVEEFRGDERMVADYLSDEFLSQIDEGDLGFLIRASVLDRLSGEICDATLGREGSAVLLRRLSRTNLLLVPLDRRDRDYRFHALLREMLAAELHRLGEDEERALHARASRWYAEHADIDRAVEHAIASGDIDAAGGLVFAAASVYAGSGRQPTLSRWIAAFTEEQVRSSAHLCATAAIVALVDADGAAMGMWVAAAERVMAESGIPDDPELEPLVALVRNLPGTESGVAESAERLSAVTPLLPEGGGWHSLSLVIDGSQRMLMGDRDRGRATIEEAVRVGRAAAPSVAAVGLGQLALIALTEDAIEEAWGYAHDAAGLLEHFGLDDYATSAFPVSLIALVSARRGDSEKARARNVAALALLSRHRDLAAWFEAEIRIAIAQTAILLDDAVRAREQLALAAQLVERVPQATVLERWLDETIRAADAAASDTNRWPLTPAEVRLLQHLPTHRSFPEIGKQLFVSTNTVKTQAQSIYRKFDVSSRAEAVECARAAGLLIDQSPQYEEDSDAG